MTKDKGYRLRAAALSVNCVGFFLGALGGLLLAGWFTGHKLLSLGEWMAGYALAFSMSGGLRVSFAGVLWDTARWPLFLWLLGYLAFGRWIIPAAFFLQGFLLAFGVAALTWSVNGGFLLAFLVFGLGNLVSLPASFLLGVQSWEQSRGLKGRRFANPAQLSGTYWKKSLLTLGAVMLGALVQYQFLPHLLEGLVPLLDQG